MSHYECGNIFRASKALLVGSGLVRYSHDTFVCNSDEEDLERRWGEDFDQDFGRYMAWVWFSVGAENLAKAALVCNRLLEQKQENNRYPFYWRDTDKENWVNEVLKYRRNAGGGYGSLGDIWKCRLDKLSEKRAIVEAEGKELKAAYKYLIPIRFTYDTKDAPASIAQIRSPQRRYAAEGWTVPKSLGCHTGVNPPNRNLRPTMLVLGDCSIVRR